MGKISVTSTEFINPFIASSTDVLKKVANIDVKLGKPYLKESPYDGSDVIIFIGITGDVRGQAFISLGKDQAIQIASNMMCGMAVTDLDDMSKSALSEISNMILGNAATLLAKNEITIDITPPAIMVGTGVKISSQKTSILCIPLETSTGGTINLDISVQIK